jgi:hypothetical protein
VNDKNKKLKVEELNRKNYLYKLKSKGLIEKKPLTKGKIKKNTELKIKKIEFEIPITMRTIMYLLE